LCRRWPAAGYEFPLTAAGFPGTGGDGAPVNPLAIK